MYVRPLCAFIPAVFFCLQACSSNSEPGDTAGYQGDTGGGGRAGGGSGGKGPGSGGAAGDNGGQTNNTGGSATAGGGGHAPGGSGGRGDAGPQSGGAGGGGGSGGRAGDKGGAAGGSGGAISDAGPRTDGSSAESSTPGGHTVTDHPGSCKAPTTYRNLFADLLGKTDAEIDQKLEDGYKSLFHGGSDETVYYEVGSDQAYIKDINNGDIRSEGMSYGMMISVQMDKKTEFNKLWTFARTVMSPSGNGLFGWKATPPSTLSDRGSAPDGEEYFATALIFASKRWGDGSGTMAYSSEAKKTLGAMISGGLFNQSAKVVNFVSGSGNTDPSYILPAFYEVWSCVDTSNQAFWKGAASTGRSVLKKACNSQTGLAPYKASYDGTPLSGNDGIFRDDSWRVVGNLMMDHNFFEVDDWQTTFAKTYAAFWAKTQKLQPMPDELQLNGTTITTHADPAKALIAQNALVGFGVPDEDGKFFVQALWDMKPPTGGYRYYDGMLYMLATLHASGRFKLWF